MYIFFFNKLVRFARKVVKLSLYYKSDKKFKNNTFFIKENHKTWRKTAQPIMKLKTTKNGYIFNWLAERGL